MNLTKHILDLDIQNFPNPGLDSSGVKSIIVDNCVCHVKWFRQEEGYGFLNNTEIEGDIFIHSSRLDPVKGTDLSAGDELVCKIVHGLRGPQVDFVYSHKHNANSANSIYRGIVKFFDRKRDYGFIEGIPDSENKDIYIKGSYARSLGVDTRKLIAQASVRFTFTVNSRKQNVACEVHVVSEKH